MLSKISKLIYFSVLAFLVEKIVLLFFNLNRKLIFSDISNCSFIFLFLKKQKITYFHNHTKEYQKMKRFHQYQHHNHLHHNPPVKIDHNSNYEPTMVMDFKNFKN